MKTKEELNIRKNEAETENKKLAELTDEALSQVSGGAYQNLENNENGHSKYQDLLLTTKKKTKQSQMTEDNLCEKYDSLGTKLNQMGSSAKNYLDILQSINESK